MELSAKSFKTMLESLTSVYEGIEKIIAARLSFLGGGGDDANKANEELLNLVAESKDFTSKYRERDGAGSLNVGSVSEADIKKAFQLSGGLQTLYGDATQLFEGSKTGSSIPKNKKITVTINNIEQEVSVGALEQGVNESFKRITKQTGAKGKQTSINAALESVLGATQSGGNLNVNHSDDRRPWAVAKDVKPGSEKAIIQASLDKYNEENGTNFEFKQKNGFLQIYDGNKAINPEQEDELNGIISGIDPVLVGGSSGDPTVDVAVTTARKIMNEEGAVPAPFEFEDKTKQADIQAAEAKRQQDIDAANEAGFAYPSPATTPTTSVAATASSSSSFSSDPYSARAAGLGEQRAAINKVLSDYNQANGTSYTAQFKGDGTYDLVQPDKRYPNVAMKPSKRKELRGLISDALHQEGLPVSGDPDGMRKSITGDGLTGITPTTSGAATADSKYIEQGKEKTRKMYATRNAGMETIGTTPATDGAATADTKYTEQGQELSKQESRGMYAARNAGMETIGTTPTTDGAATADTKYTEEGKKKTRDMYATRNAGMKTIGTLPTTDRAATIDPDSGDGPDVGPESERQLGIKAANDAGFAYTPPSTLPTTDRAATADTTFTADKLHESPPAEGISFVSDTSSSIAGTSGSGAGTSSYGTGASVTIASTSDDAQADQEDKESTYRKKKSDTSSSVADTSGSGAGTSSYGTGASVITVGSVDPPTSGGGLSAFERTRATTPIASSSADPEPSRTVTSRDRGMY